MHSLPVGGDYLEQGIALHILSLGRRSGLNHLPETLSGSELSLWGSLSPSLFPLPSQGLYGRHSRDSLGFPPHTQRASVRNSQKHEQNHCPHLPEWELLALGFGCLATQKLSKQSPQHRGGCRSDPCPGGKRDCLRSGSVAESPPHWGDTQTLPSGTDADCRERPWRKGHLGHKRICRHIVPQPPRRENTTGKAGYRDWGNKTYDIWKAWRLQHIRSVYMEQRKLN